MKKKKDKKSVRQKIADKLMLKMQPYIEIYVKEHDKWLLEQVIHRIEFLSIQDNFCIELLINDLKKGDFAYDKEKHI